MKNNALISIIIPAYNAEATIEKCVKSILIQDIGAEEIIIVNDGSTDKTESIAQRLAMSNKNIKLISCKNGGQARARNIGLKKASGDYVMFVDSDDYFEGVFGAEFKKLVSKKPDIIIMGHKKETNKRITVGYDKEYLNKNEAGDVKERIVISRIYNDAPWGKIIRRKILEKNNIVFPEGKLSEDIVWCAKILALVNNDRITILNSDPYIYVQGSKTVSKNISAKHCEDIVDIFKNIAIKNEDNAVQIYYSYEYFAMVGALYSSNNKEGKNSCRRELLQYSNILKFGKGIKRVKYALLLKRIIGMNLTARILGGVISLRRINNE